MNVHWIDRKSNPLNETAKKKVGILKQIPFNTGNRTYTHFFFLQIVRSINEFCKNSSIHGIRYFVEKSHLIER